MKNEYRESLTSNSVSLENKLIYPCSQGIAVKLRFEWKNVVEESPLLQKEGRIFEVTDFSRKNRSFFLILHLLQFLAF